MWLILICDYAILLHCEGKIMERKLRITGKASVSANPDKIKVFMNLVAEAQTAELANSVFSKKVTLINNILKQLGFKADALKTESFVIDKNYEWQNNKQVEIGYKAVAHYSLVMDLDYAKLEKLISDVSAALGVKVTYNVFLSNEQALSDKAIELAIEDAFNKAELIAKKSKITLGGLVDINYVSEPSFAAYRAMGANIAPSEDITITRSVDMTWEFGK